MSLGVQFYTVGMMVLSGHAIGFIYDLFNVLFRKLKLPRWTMPIMDLLYWIVATLLVFGVLIHSNEGQVRIFVFTSMGVGVCLYFLLFSKTIVKVIHFLIKVVITLYQTLVKIFHYTVIMPIKGLYRLTLIILGFLVTLTIFLYKIVLQLLYPVWKLLLWFIKPLLKQVGRIPRPKWIVALYQKLKPWILRLIRK